MSRKLASIRLISGLQPISGADFIEVAEIEGWRCIVKKGEFKPGDKCVFFEIDSFLPVRPEFEFLRKNCLRAHADGTEGFRLKTIKLRGELSQGLALPCRDLALEEAQHELEEDLTELLGVKLWESKIRGSGPFNRTRPKGNFPTHIIPKTDEERIQNLKSKWSWISTGEGHKVYWEVTQKLDGSSITCYWDGEKFGVCSRNLELARPVEGDPVSVVWNIVNKFKLEEVFPQLSDSLGWPFALQGELIGPGIQGNPHKLSAVEYRPFSVWIIGGNMGGYQNYSTVRQICDTIGLTTVPFITHYDDISAATVEDLINGAEGIDLLGGDEREGLVFRSFDRETNRLVRSFKAISNKYLLGHDG